MGAYMSSWFSGPGFAFAFGCFLIFQAFLMGWKNLKKGERGEEARVKGLRACDRLV